MGEKQTDDYRLRFAPSGLAGLVTNCHAQDL